MKYDYHQYVLQATGAKAIRSQEVIQTLWSGYGEIVRLQLDGGDVESVVLKYISVPEEIKHPRGWNTPLSHVRKLKSYDVEMHWYGEWADRCHTNSRVAHCYATFKDESDQLIILEDLDASGFSMRHSQLDFPGVVVCLQWLASFHAQFLSQKVTGLWATGSYWHLETRPDELVAMEDGPLKQAATQLDALLNNCKYKTLIHGDAKVANFCFTGSLDSSAGVKVAAVDFQYVGAGCGMKDVVYFLGSCLTETQCRDWESKLLDVYFDALKNALQEHDKKLDFYELEKEWREMYAVAWTDFYRFLMGWMPGHQKINSYTQMLADRVLVNL